MNSAEVLIKFKGDTKDVDKSIDNVKQGLSVKNLVKADLISSAIKGVVGQIANITKGIVGIGTSVVKLAATGGMDRALNIEQARFKLQGLGHDANETQMIMDNALAAVKGTAYGLDEAATIAASAVAAGVKPGKELERTLKLVGDAATISGRDMNSMGAIFNKIAANGKITGEELNQLADSGIPILSLLSDTMGKSTEEVRSLVSAGKVGFAEFQTAIEKGMGGAALTMGQTFNGALANMKAALSRIGASVMGPLTESLTPIMGTVTNILDAVLSGATDEVEKNMNLLKKQIPQMVNNVVKALEPILKNVLPIIQQLFPMIIGLLNQYMPQIISGITDMILSLLPLLINCLSQLAVGIINSLPAFIQQLSAMLPTLITSLIQGVVQVTNALAKQLPTIIPTLVTAILDGLLSILDNIDLLVDAGINLIMALADGLIEALPILIEKLPIIIEKLVAKLIVLAPKLLAVGPKLIIKLISGLLGAIPTLVDNLPKIIQAIADGLKKGVGQLGNVGKQLINGLINGLKGMANNAVNAAKSIGKAMLGGLKNMLGIHSPSTEFALIGKFSVLGYTEALSKMRRQVQTQMQETFGISPQLANSSSLHYSPNVVVNNQMNMTTDPLGQVVGSIKTFANGSKNDYNYGMGA